MTGELTNAFRQVFGDEAADRAAHWNANKSHDPTSNLDEDTLRRMHGLSRGARREQRRPRDVVLPHDEGLDVDGWAIGARYPRRSA